MLINSQELKSAIAAVKPAIGTRGDIPTLKSVLVKGNTLTAYNLETGIIATIDGHTDEPFLMPPKAIDLIPKLPDDDVKIEVGKVITLECGDIIATYPVEDVEDFPEVEIGGELSEPIQIDGDWFRWAVKATAYAVAKVDTKPVQKGVLLDCKNGYINLVASDGYRVSWVKKECDGEWQINVLPESLKSLLSLNDDIFIKHSRGRAIFECGDISVIARTISGEFMDYQTIVTSSNLPNELTVDRKQLLLALERVDTQRGGKGIPTTVFDIKGGAMKLSLGQAIGTFGEPIPIKHNADLHIGFNHRYLKECVESFKSEALKIQYGGSLSPFKVTGEGDVGLLSMVTAVALRKTQ